MIKFANFVDHNANNSSAKICVRGIVKKKQLSDIKKQLTDKDIRFVKSFTFPILHIVSRSDVNQIYSKMNYLSYFKNIISIASKCPSLLNSMKWIAVEITVPIDKVHDFQYFKPNTINSLDKKLIFISREVARLGFSTNNLGNTLEYEIVRNINSYNLLLAVAKIVIPELSLSIPTSRRRLSRLSPEDKLQLVDLLGRYTYFIDDIKDSDQKSSNDGGSNLVFNSVYKGKLRHLTENSEESQINDVWIYHQLNKVEVLHGLIIYKRGEFYSYDKTKIPIYGSLHNYWPSYIYQNSKLDYYSVNCPVNIGNLEEAIFIGGTNNWMHFLIEDLPRIVKFELKVPNPGIPIVVVGNLSQQILAAIAILTKRNVIVCDSFQSLSVEKLHIYYFVNTLHEVSNGDYHSAHKLFDHESIKIAQDKFLQISKNDTVSNKNLFIRREAGLFRPLVNAKKLQSILEVKYHFKTVYLQDLTLTEVINHMQSARVIVVEYGAAIGNIIFANPNCTIVEIRSEREFSHIEYQILGELLNLDYRVIKSKKSVVSRKGIVTNAHKVRVKAVINLLEALKLD